MKEERFAHKSSVLGRVAFEAACRLGHGSIRAGMEFNCNGRRFLVTTESMHGLRSYFGFEDITSERRPDQHFTDAAAYVTAISRFPGFARCVQSIGRNLRTLPVDSVDLRDILAAALAGEFDPPKDAGAGHAHHGRSEGEATKADFDEVAEVAAESAPEAASGPAAEIMRLRDELHFAKLAAKAALSELESCRKELAAMTKGRDNWKAEAVAHRKENSSREDVIYKLVGTVDRANSALAEITKEVSKATAKAMNEWNMIPF